MMKHSFAEKALLQGAGIHGDQKLKSNAQRPLKRSALALLSVLAMVAYIHLLLMVLIQIHSSTI
jgi:hypothetical protein